MPADPLIVNDDSGQPFYDEADHEKPTNLEGREIHPVFAQRNFRYADYTQNLAPCQLDQGVYNFSDILYERMKPALRLATLFLRTVMPDLAHIKYAPIFEEFVKLADGTSKSRGYYLDLGYEFTDIARFEKDIFPMIHGKHRFTILKQAAGLGDTQSNTSLMLTHIGRPEDYFKPILHTQTAISSDWLWFLSRPDYETLTDSEKYGYLFLLATFLVKEIAHLCWIDRVQDEVDTSSSDDGPFTLYEPRFSIDHRYFDLGYGTIEFLFGGIPGLSNHGSVSSIQPRPRHGEAYRVSFSFIDDKGRTLAVHDTATKTLFSFFTDAHPLWKQLENPSGGEVEWDYLLLKNDGPLRRRFSTDLSSSPLLDAKSTAPTVKMPDPRSLKSAITAANPFVPRNSKGNVTVKSKNRFRETKMLMRRLIVTSGNWWDTSYKGPARS